MARAFVMEFERPLVELEDKLEALRRLDVRDNPQLEAEIEGLAAEIERLREDLYASLSAWDKVQVARHPDRPKTQDYVAELFDDVFELRGDRLFGDDEAVLAALATFRGTRALVLGHRKGKDTKENIRRNFGSPHPEGYRKALRAMRLAQKAGLPVVCFVDTQGAYPGIDAEERGQAWAIAENLAALSALRVPVMVFGIGEGGSGGALAMGVGDRLVMLENAYYSVVSPEGCASILYKDAAHAPECAAALRMTAGDLLGMGIADEVVAEPRGGAHRDPGMVFSGVADALSRALGDLAGQDPDTLVEERYRRLRAVGAFAEAEG